MPFCPKRPHINGMSPNSRGMSPTCPFARSNSIPYIQGVSANIQGGHVADMPLRIISASSVLPRAVPYIDSRGMSATCPFARSSSIPYIQGVSANIQGGHVADMPLRSYLPPQLCPEQSHILTVGACRRHALLPEAIQSHIFREGMSPTCPYDHICLLSFAQSSPIYS